MPSRLPERSRWGNAARSIVWLPAILSAITVYACAVNVPIWDEWSIADLLHQFDSSALTLHQLLGQHNEHRPFVPRIIQIAVAVLFSWDTRYMMWMSQTVLLALAFGILRLSRNLLKANPSWTLPSVVIAMWLLYSPAQHQNTLWGFQLCFLIPGACLFGCTMVMGRGHSLSAALATTAVLSTIATFSTFAGILLWPLAAVGVRISYGSPGRSAVWRWLAWLCCGGAVLYLYFAGYVQPSNSPPPLQSFRAPLTLIVGVATCIGVPLSVGNQPLIAAAAIGTIAIMGFGLSVFVVWRCHEIEHLATDATPWILMGSFGVLSAAAIAVGRIGYDTTALLESRYSTLTNWTFISTMMLAAHIRQHIPGRMPRLFWIAATVSITILFSASLPRHIAATQRSFQERLQSKAVYVFAHATENGSPLVPPWMNWSRIKDAIVSLEENGWRPLRPVVPTWANGEQLEQNCAAGVVEAALRIGERTMATGWAVLPHETRAADGILMTTASRHILALQVPTIGRADIAARFSSDAAQISGWLIDSRQEQADAEFWALDARQLVAYPLCREGR